MCCLAYEDDYYAEASKQVPKTGAAVVTPEGEGTVVSVNMLKMEVRVKIEKDGALVYRDFPAADVARGAHEARKEAPAPSEASAPEEGAQEGGKRREEPREGGKKREQGRRDRHKDGRRERPDRPERPAGGKPPFQKERPSRSPQGDKPSAPEKNPEN